MASLMTCTKCPCDSVADRELPHLIDRKFMARPAQVVRSGLFHIRNSLMLLRKQLSSEENYRGGPCCWMLHSQVSKPKTLQVQSRHIGCGSLTPTTNVRQGSLSLNSRSSNPHLLSVESVEAKRRVPAPDRQLLRDLLLPGGAPRERPYGKSNPHNETTKPTSNINV